MGELRARSEISFTHAQRASLGPAGPVEALRRSLGFRLGPCFQLVQAAKPKKKVQRLSGGRARPFQTRADVRAQTARAWKDPLAALAVCARTSAGARSSVRCLCYYLLFVFLPPPLPLHEKMRNVAQIRMVRFSSKFGHARKHKKVGSLSLSLPLFLYLCLRLCIHVAAIDPRAIAAPA